MSEREFFGKAISCRHLIKAESVFDSDRLVSDPPRCMSEAVKYANDAKSTYTDVQCEIDPVVEPISGFGSLTQITIFCSGIKK